MNTTNNKTIKVKETYLDGSRDARERLEKLLNEEVGEIIHINTNPTKYGTYGKLVQVVTVIYVEKEKE